MPTVKWFGSVTFSSRSGRSATRIDGDRPRQGHRGPLLTANLTKMRTLGSGLDRLRLVSFVNSMLVSCSRATPQECRMILIDPKMVELTRTRAFRT